MLDWDERCQAARRMIWFDPVLFPSDDVVGESELNYINVVHQAMFVSSIAGLPAWYMEFSNANKAWQSDSIPRDHFRQKI